MLSGGNESTRTVPLLPGFSREQTGNSEKSVRDRRKMDLLYCRRMLDTLFIKGGSEYVPYDYRKITAPLF
jgi:hypothetical protein